MRILYGVQGTGNGHLTRARAMARALRAHRGVTVDWLFSGRPREAFQDMEVFGDWRWRQGLSFVCRDGRVSLGETWRALSLARFARDAVSLPLQAYDCILTDFEPVTAWAACLAGRECIGLGHQYALVEGVPRASGHALGALLLRAFAPVDTAIGLHWHHFDRAILPPIVDGDVMALASAPPAAVPRVLVYLPFEDPSRVLGMLHSLPTWKFEVFGPGLSARQEGNVTLQPVGRGRFLEALGQCTHVVCNCGFELISEAVHLGRRVLARPLDGQVEQASNALALEALGLARVCDVIDAGVLSAFLAFDVAPLSRCRYPDVAAAIAAWIIERRDPLAVLAARLWCQGEGIPPRPPSAAANRVAFL